MQLEFVAIDPLWIRAGVDVSFAASSSQAWIREIVAQSPKIANFIVSSLEKYRTNSSLTISSSRRHNSSISFTRNKPALPKLPSASEGGLTGRVIYVAGTDCQPAFSYKSYKNF